MLISGLISAVTVGPAPGTAPDAIPTSLASAVVNFTQVTMQDAGDLVERPLDVLGGQRLGVDPADLRVDPVRPGGVAERLGDREVGVGQLDVLADEGDLESGLRPLDPLDHRGPALERRLAGPVDPERYLLLLETGDEVLDYREALARYAGAETVVVEGGNHTLESYPQQLPRILAFARIGAAG